MWRWFLNKYLAVFFPLKIKKKKNKTENITLITQKRFALQLTALDL